MKARILPTLAALWALVKRPFRRTPKVKMYRGPVPVTRDPGRGPSLRGNGKASRQLRKLRRLIISRSFTRLLEHKPIGAGTIAQPGVAWREAFRSFEARWDEHGRKSIRTGRRRQKRARKLRRLIEVHELKKARGGMSRLEFERVSRIVEVA